MSTASSAWYRFSQAILASIYSLGSSLAMPSDREDSFHPSSFLTASSIAVLSPVAQNQKQCDITRIFFDIGSSSVKVRAGLIDSCNGREKQVLISQKIPHNCSDLFKAGKYVEAIGLISDLIAQYRDEVMLTLPPPVQSASAMTAEFRYNANPNDPRGFDVQVTENTGITSMIVTQQWEGIQGYYSILDKLQSGFMPQLPRSVREGGFMSWDVGGGSQQFSVRDHQDAVTVHGSTLGAGRYYNLVRQFIRPEHALDLFPVSELELTQMRNIVKVHMAYPQLSNDIKDDFDNATPVFGVGLLHSRSILPLIKEAGTKTESEESYTRSELKRAVNLWRSYPSDADFKKACRSCMPNNPTQDFTNLVLVLSVMEHYDIEKVYVAHANSMDTVLLRHANWSKIIHEPVTLMRLYNVQPHTNDALAASEERHLRTTT